MRLVERLHMKGDGMNDLITLTIASVGIANLEIATVGKPGELHQFISCKLYGRPECFELTAQNEGFTAHQDPQRTENVVGVNC
eukprot:4451410-Amphidinium_carterae.3